MKENNIIEILNKIKDKNNLRNDMMEILSLTTDLFKRKYIDEIKLHINKHLEVARENPTKEVYLLQSLKPFLKENKNIDRFIETMVNVKVFNEIKENIKSINNVDKKIELMDSNLKKTPSEINSDESIKPDGVYDVDEECLYLTQHNKEPRANIMVVLLIFLLIFNV